MAHSPTPWFLGRDLADEDGDSWDGTVQSPPTGQDVAHAEQSKATDNPFDAGPYEVAKVHDIQDAKRILLCVNACQGVSDECLERAAALAKAGKKTVLALVSQMQRALMNYERRFENPRRWAIGESKCSRSLYKTLRKRGYGC